MIKSHKVFSEGFKHTVATWFAFHRFAQLCRYNLFFCLPVAPFCVGSVDVVVTEESGWLFDVGWPPVLDYSTCSIVSLSSSKRRGVGNVILFKLSSLVSNGFDGSSGSRYVWGTIGAIIAAQSLSQTHITISVLVKSHFDRKRRILGIGVSFSRITGISFLLLTPVDKDRSTLNKIIKCIPRSPIGWIEKIQLYNWTMN